jgi:hypothetical protein
LPPDLRALLSLALPISAGFPNWRSDPPDELQRRLDRPADGICFDIEHNGFWYDRWGPRPSDLAEACALARRQVSAAPKLVPVYSHRFIVAEPARAGNPVLSVVQADILYYGDDLEDYLAHEFEGRRVRRPPTSAGSVPFWDDIVMGRHRGGR